MVNRKQRRTDGRVGSSEAGQAKLRPSSPLEETLFGQALEHHQGGRIRIAEIGYRDVLAINPQHPGALSYLGLLAHQSGHSEAGIDLLKKAIASDRRNAALHYNMACVLSDCGRDDEAIAHNRKAIELKPDYSEAYNNLGALLLLRERPVEALATVIKGLQIEATEDLKSAFVMVVRSLDPAKIPIEKTFISFLVRALNEPWCRPRDLSHVAASILMRSPAMNRQRRASLAGTPHRLNELFMPEDLTSIGRDGLLHALLSTSPVTTIELERILTATRHALLVEAGSGSIDSLHEWLPFASAIAQQCFINEYVFNAAGDESDRVLELRDAVAGALESGEHIEPIKIAILAGYLPLHSIPGSERLVSRDWPEPIRSLIAQQISSHSEERAIRLEIESLTPIDNLVSEKVREQYEENPYPKWTKAFANTRAMPIDHYVQTRFPGAPYKGVGNGPLDFLIAGCGTGMHAIQRAQQFKSADILAIDLSLSSLSYAIRKTRELGLTNIRYAQADILALEWDRKFHVIDSSGVLHHLKDPLEGWRKLASMLHPGGLMHIGLYSAIARKDINAARAHLTQLGREYSAPEVRRLRTEIAGLPQGEQLSKISQFSDFFSMSECRDLLFHVQEYQFSIPEISAFLAENGFTFVGFETSARNHYLKEFPGDAAAVDLKNWNAFEINHPSTFAQMYQFWIQKN